jgi:hypothetical protein
MKWVSGRRPAPGTLLGFAALIVALGGVAYATIPDSNGTIHGCYQKRTGSLRVVESPGDCKANERPLDWQSGSQPSTIVVQRATSTQSVTSRSLVPFDVKNAGAEIPLTGNTWTQAANETDKLYGIVHYTPPAHCDSAGSTGFMAVDFLVDGEIEGFAVSDRNTGSTAIIQASPELYVYEPGAPTNRALTAKVGDTCTDGSHFTVDSARVSVAGIR